MSKKPPPLTPAQVKACVARFDSLFEQSQMTHMESVRLFDQIQNGDESQLTFRRFERSLDRAAKASAAFGRYSDAMRQQVCDVILKRRAQGAA